MNPRLLPLAIAALAGLGLGSLTALFVERESGFAGSVSALGKERSSAEADSAPGIADPDEPLTRALEALMGPSDLGALARLGSALALMDSAQMKELLDRLERADANSYDARLMWLFRRWLDRDPEGAREWIDVRLLAAAQDGPIGHTFDYQSQGMLLLAWARADPRGTLQYVRNNPGAALASRLLSEAMITWPERDTPSRLAALLTIPPGTARQVSLRKVLAELAEQDPLAALAEAKALAGNDERQQCISSVLQAWGRKDAAAALAAYEAWGVEDFKVLDSLVYTLATTHPLRALEWLNGSGAAQLGRLGPKIAAAWARQDPAAALSWALEQGVNIGATHGWEDRVSHDGFTRSTGSSSSGNRPFLLALEAKPEATLAWLRGLPPGPLRDELTRAAAIGLRDLNQSLELFSSLPPAAATPAAFDIGRRFSADPEGGSKWAASLAPGKARTNAWRGLGSSLQAPLDLPPGSDRDAMYSGLTISNTALNDPQFALEQALKIDNPVLRRDTFEWILDFTLKHQKEKVRLWMESPAAPEEWSRRWREEEAKQARP